LLGKNNQSIKYHIRVKSKYFMLDKYMPFINCNNESRKPLTLYSDNNYENTDNLEVEFFSESPFCFDQLLPLPTNNYYNR